ncbi:MAG TPA: hypothetical protein PLA94_21585 [Myxococcota bacterium]|nr:hypothetical protein [Myxococcota bacterium]
MFQLLERGGLLSCFGLLLQLSACTPVHRDPYAPDVVPRMPSPLGQIYTRAAQEPGDPVVKKALRELPWDEVLSGVASGLALDLLQGDEPGAFQIRWRGVLAAWPYPVLGMRTEQTEYDAIPVRLIEEAKRQASLGMDLGLVRGRSGEGDLWVLVWSRRTAELGPIPREPSVGQRVELVGADFTVVDPLGVRKNLGEGAWVPSEPGEWLLEARTPGGQQITRIPIFVGEATPLLPPIQKQATGEPENAAWALFSTIRTWYQLPLPERDPGLDAVARVRLRSLVAGEKPPPAEGMLRSAGYVDVPVGSAECTATTVADCLDQLWWSTEFRAFYQGDWTAVGLASGLRGDRLVLAWVAAG